jgi:hypothetical protein
MSQIGLQYRIARDMQGLSTDCTVENLSVIPKGATVHIEEVYQADRILTIRHRESLLYIFQLDLRACGVRILGARKLSDQTGNLSTYPTASS